jgi:hypothetical protein
VVVTLSWVIGLDFLLGLWLSLLGALALVVYWSATKIILFVKVKVLGGGLCAYGWVKIFLYFPMVKRAHPFSNTKHVSLI